MRSFHLPGRSPVMARNAMVATSHPLASDAALQALRAGGNAVDAALTATAVLCVVEPHMTGIGGDCFALVAPPDGPLQALSGAGRAPAAATRDAVLRALAARGLEPVTDGFGQARVPRECAQAVTVPGAIAGWWALHQAHGRLPWEEVFTPAIAAARDGFAVASRVAADWHETAPRIRQDNDATAMLLGGDGDAPVAGDVWRFPALAGTLRTIATAGRDGFYRGPVAEDMVAKLHAIGGLHTMDDFAAQDATWEAPLSRPVAGVPETGLDLVEMPPINQGLLAQMMMGILARVPAYRGAGPVSAQRYHIMMEAARLAYTARGQYLADPEVEPVPTDHLLSDAILDALAARIDADRRTPDLGLVPPPSGSNTIYLAVADADGMTVSFINSLFSNFGSAIVAPGAGVAFNNRAQGFTLDEGHPNVIAPRKRPMHTLAPGMLLRNGRPAMAFGVMGADFQPTGQVYVLSNMLHFGMDAQEALDAPRIFFEAPPAGVLGAEDGVPDAVIDELRAMGHDVQRRQEPWGGGQAVEIRNRADGDGRVLIGASDPRKDGCALGY